ncbi:MAG: translation initiation factor IF-2 [Chitinophagaceae bacterium]|nr:MAG: translation initiation factor IF-2 [Chitinophagaceae bacterium]
MSELKLPRLLAAAKEFNIGQDTLIDFLVKKGFSKDDLKPTAKLQEDQYRALQAEFQGDKVAKNKADQVEIPKVAQSEARKKKDEEEITFRKEEKKVVAAAPKEEVKVQEPVTPAPAPVVEAPAPAPIAEKPLAAEVFTVPTPVVETPAPAPVDVPAPVQETKKESTNIEGPKVINKIDLSTIDSSTRPKKTAKKAEPFAAPKAAAPAAPVEKPKPAPVAKAPVVEVAAPAAPEADLPPTIENIRADKLEGPKILGKIDLPVNSDTRPKPMGRDEKRKRKRIPVDKKGDNNAPAAAVDSTVAQVVEIEVVTEMIAMHLVQKIKK